jgi:hypothetical protein
MRLRAFSRRRPSKFMIVTVLEYSTANKIIIVYLNIVRLRTKATECFHILIFIFVDRKRKILNCFLSLLVKLNFVF